MAKFNCNILLAILAALVLIGVIYYLNKSDDQIVPNTGTIANINLPEDQMRQYNERLNNPIQNNSVGDNVIDDLVSRYGADDLVSASDPMANRHQVFDDYVHKKYPSMSKADNLMISDEVSDSRDFLHKKQKFTRRTQDDIDDLFDVNKMLPQENEEGWFDTSILQSAKKIKGTHMINPKTHFGINTIGTHKKNGSLDIRGDIPNPKIDVSPWGNSTIDRDDNGIGLCFKR